MDAAGEGHVLADVLAVEVELVRILEPARIAVGGTGSTITAVPAGMSTPPMLVALRANRKSLLTGLSIRSDSSMKPGIRLRSSRSCCCMSGRSPITCSAALSSLAVVSCPAAKRNVAERTTSMTSGVDPSGYFAVASEVSTSSRGSLRRSSM